MTEENDLFSTAGIATWHERLNASTTFARAAAGWHGSLVLVEQESGTVERRTWIVVADGACREARVASGEDDRHADFVLSASRETWSELADARVTPAMAALSGRLRLAKGEFLRLAPHAKAAAALLAAAARGSPT